MPCSTLVSQTAVPAGRPITISSICAMKSATGIDISCSRRRTSDVPRRQHHIRNAMPPPTVSGNQPPSTIFSELAARKPQSTVPNTAITGTAASSGQCQRRVTR